MSHHTRTSLSLSKPVKLCDLFMLLMAQGLSWPLLRSLRGVGTAPVPAGGCLQTHESSAFSGSLGTRKDQKKEDSGQERQAGPGLGLRLWRGCGCVLIPVRTRAPHPGPRWAQWPRGCALQSWQRQCACPAGWAAGSQQMWSVLSPPATCSASSPLCDPSSARFPLGWSQSDCHFFQFALLGKHSPFKRKILSFSSLLPICILLSFIVPCFSSFSPPSFSFPLSVG